MSNQLQIIDLVIILCYLAAMLLAGFHFSRKNKSADRFTRASGRIPGWAVGMSIFATFLSSNTFLGVPGKTFGSNWNVFVFSLSMPLAAWVAVKYFIPFYRNSGEISAYTHFENRFGPWARTYAVVCFLLTQLARMGSIFFGIALTLQALTGFDMKTIMMVTGACIIVYTVLGGIEAVIWTEVAQAVIKTFGALLILYLVVVNMPGGVKQIMQIGNDHQKFSLGSFHPDFTQPTFWVILLYGFFINLNNFGVDQNYVQRYHTAASPAQAKRSVWICVAMYLPASLIFCIIGSSLFAYYQAHPGLIDVVKHQVAVERAGVGASSATVAQIAGALKPGDYGDKIMPYFMVTKIPVGLIGLIVSAVLSAAMSTISSGMNASSTVFSLDIYKRYFKPSINEKQKLRILHLATVVFGLGGMLAGVAMIGIKSVLDIWWMLSGIFASGMLGLFLLGIISKQTGNAAAMAATFIGIAVVLWMTLPSLIPDQYQNLRNGLDVNMTIVVGTLSIFLAGILLTRFKTTPNYKNDLLTTEKS
ncbi:MAG: sodium:solute symporter [Bacteroidetes bacterium]|nr:sodium:solute symporter [Bacteroidota bacterium]